jgi:hypothetical protein
MQEPLSTISGPSGLVSQYKVVVEQDEYTKVKKIWIRDNTI